jgi:hypothetical protein
MPYKLFAHQFKKEEWIKYVEPSKPLNPVIYDLGISIDDRKKVFNDDNSLYVTFAEEFNDYSVFNYWISNKKDKHATNDALFRTQFKNLYNVDFERGYNKNLLLIIMNNINDINDIITGEDIIKLSKEFVHFRIALTILLMVRPVILRPRNYMLYINYLDDIEIDPAFYQTIKDWKDYMKIVGIKIKGISKMKKVELYKELCDERDRMKIDYADICLTTHRAEEYSKQYIKLMNDYIDYNNEISQIYEYWDFKCINHYYHNNNVLRAEKELDEWEKTDKDKITSHNYLIR